MTASSGAPASLARPRNASLLDYLSLLLIRWRLVVAAALITGLAALAVTFVMSEEWTADVSFLPVSSTASPLSSALGGLAGDLGLSLPGASPTDGPEFYVALLKSREILDDVLTTAYRVRGDSQPLLDLLKIEGDTLPERLEEGRGELNEMFSASSDRGTQIVTVKVRAPDPGLAAAVANRFVELANTYNREGRGFQARETRRFIEARLKESEETLRDAEDVWRAFRTRNRQFQTPELALEDQRLQRQIQVQQGIYMSLRQQYENARIQEVNDTPVLSVVERAVPPVRRSSPRRGRTTAIALVLGGFLGAGWALAQGMLQQLRASSDPGLARLEAAWQAARPRR